MSPEKKTILIIPLFKSITRFFLNITKSSGRKGGEDEEMQRCRRKEKNRQQSHNYMSYKMITCQLGIISFVNNY